MLVKGAPENRVLPDVVDMKPLCEYHFFCLLALARYFSTLEATCVIKALILTLVQRHN